MSSKKHNNGAALQVGAGAGPPSARRGFLLLLKLAVSFALCVWIVSFVDWELFSEAVRGSRFWVAGLAFLMLVGGVMISFEKWRELLGIHRLRFRAGELLRWYFVAMFLNHFLPTSIGGDGYRIYKTWNNDRGRSRAFSAVFVDRLSGLLALLLMGYSAALVLYIQSGDSIAGVLLTVVTFGGLSVGGAFWAMRRFELFGRLARLKYFPKALLRLDDVLVDFIRAPRRTLLVGAISMVFHLNKLGVVWLLLYSLGSVTNVLELAVVIVAADLVGLLPISIGGLGVIEGSFMVAVGHYGVAHEIALAAMLMMRVFVIPLSFIGAYFYFRGDRPAEPIDLVNRESEQPESAARPLTPAESI